MDGCALGFDGRKRRGRQTTVLRPLEVEDAEGEPTVGSQSQTNDSDPQSSIDYTLVAIAEDGSLMTGAPETKRRRGKKDHQLGIDTAVEIAGRCGGRTLAHPEKQMGNATGNTSLGNLFAINDGAREPIMEAGCARGSSSPTFFEGLYVGRGTGSGSANSQLLEMCSSSSSSSGLTKTQKYQQSMHLKGRSMDTMGSTTMQKTDEQEHTGSNEKAKAKALLAKEAKVLLKEQQRKDQEQAGLSDEQERRREEAEDAVNSYLWDYIPSAVSGGWAGKKLVHVDRLAQKIIREDAVESHQCKPHKIRMEWDGAGGTILDSGEFFESQTSRRDRIKIQIKWMVHMAALVPLNEQGQAMYDKRVEVPLPVTSLAKDEESEENESWRNAKSVFRHLYYLLPWHPWAQLCICDPNVDSGGASLPSVHYIEELVFEIIEVREENDSQMWKMFADCETGFFFLPGTCWQHPNNTTSQNASTEGCWALNIDSSCLLNRLRKEIQATTRHRLGISRAMSQNREKFGAKPGIGGRDLSRVINIYGKWSKISKLQFRMERLAEAHARAETSQRCRGIQEGSEEFADAVQRETRMEQQKLHDAEMDCLAGLRQCQPTRWGSVGNAARSRAEIEIVGGMLYLEAGTQIDFDAGKYLRTPAEDSHVAACRVVGAGLIPSDRLTRKMNDNDSVTKEDILGQVARSTSAVLLQYYLVDEQEWAATELPEGFCKNRFWAPGLVMGAGVFILFCYDLEMQTRLLELDDADKFFLGFDRIGKQEQLENEEDLDFRKKVAAEEEAYVTAFCAGPAPQRIRTRPNGLQSVWRTLRRKTPKCAVALTRKLMECRQSKWKSTRRCESNHAIVGKASDTSSRVRGLELVSSMSHAAALCGRLRNAQKLLKKIEALQATGNFTRYENQRPYDGRDVLKGAAGFGASVRVEEQTLEVQQKIKEVAEVWNRLRKSDNHFAAEKARERLLQLAQEKGTPIRKLEQTCQETLDYFLVLRSRLIEEYLKKDYSIEDSVMAQIERTYNPLNFVLPGSSKNQFRLWGDKRESEGRHFAHVCNWFFSLRSRKRKAQAAKLRADSTLSFLQSRLKETGVTKGGRATGQEPSSTSSHNATAQVMEEMMGVLEQEMVEHRHKPQRNPKREDKDALKLNEDDDLFDEQEQEEGNDAEIEKNSKNSKKSKTNKNKKVGPTTSTATTSTTTSTNDKSKKGKCNTTTTTTSTTEGDALHAGQEDEEDDVGGNLKKEVEQASAVIQHDSILVLRVRFDTLQISPGGNMYDSKSRWFLVPHVSGDGTYSGVELGQSPSDSDYETEEPDPQMRISYCGGKFPRATISSSFPPPFDMESGGTTVEAYVTHIVGCEGAVGSLHFGKPEPVQLPKMNVRFAGRKMKQLEKFLPSIEEEEEDGFAEEVVDEGACQDLQQPRVVELEGREVEEDEGNATGKQKKPPANNQIWAFSKPSLHPLLTGESFYGGFEPPRDDRGFMVDSRLLIRKPRNDAGLDRKPYNLKPKGVPSAQTCKHGHGDAEKEAGQVPCSVAETPARPSPSASSSIPISIAVDNHNAGSGGSAATAAGILPVPIPMPPSASGSAATSSSPSSSANTSSSSSSDCASGTGTGSDITTKLVEDLARTRRSGQEVANTGSGPGDIVCPDLEADGDLNVRKSFGEWTNHFGLQNVLKYVEKKRESFRQAAAQEQVNISAEVGPLSSPPAPAVVNQASLGSSALSNKENIVNTNINNNEVEVPQDGVPGLVTPRNDASKQTPSSNKSQVMQLLPAASQLRSRRASVSNIDFDGEVDEISKGVQKLDLDNAVPVTVADASKNLVTPCSKSINPPVTSRSASKAAATVAVTEAGGSTARNKTSPMCISDEAKKRIQKASSARKAALYQQQQSSSKDQQRKTSANWKSSLVIRSAGRSAQKAPSSGLVLQASTPGSGRKEMETSEVDLLYEVDGDHGLARRLWSTEIERNAPRASTSGDVGVAANAKEADEMLTRTSADWLADAEKAQAMRRRKQVAAQMLRDQEKAKEHASTSRSASPNPLEADEDLVLNRRLQVHHFHGDEEQEGKPKAADESQNQLKRVKRPANMAPEAVQARAEARDRHRKSVDAVLADTIGGFYFRPLTTGILCRIGVHHIEYPAFHSLFSLRDGPQLLGCQSNGDFTKCSMGHGPAALNVYLSIMAGRARFMMRFLRSSYPIYMSSADKKKVDECYAEWMKPLRDVLHLHPTIRPDCEMSIPLHDDAYRRLVAPTSTDLHFIKEGDRSVVMKNRESAAKVVICNPFTDEGDDYTGYDAFDPEVAFKDEGICNSSDEEEFVDNWKGL
ncbi:unnamed protein product [Amoebophrya sp. A25]|nr:unnamed protein product [Amoebophrya sp. A25]|eukprot:GSA25T00009278001.1